MSAHVRIGVAVLLAVIGTTVATTVAADHGSAGRALAVGVSASLLGVWLRSTADK